VNTRPCQTPSGDVDPACVPQHQHHLNTNITSTPTSPQHQHHLNTNITSTPTSSSTLPKPYALNAKPKQSHAASVHALGVKV
jgi:hypothetical protein